MLTDEWRLISSTLILYDYYCITGPCPKQSKQNTNTSAFLWVILVQNTLTFCTFLCVHDSWDILIFFLVFCFCFKCCPTFILYRGDSLPTNIHLTRTCNIQSGSGTTICKFCIYLSFEGIEPTIRNADNQSHSHYAKWITYVS